MKAFFVKVMKGEAHFVYMCTDVFKELSVQFSLACGGVLLLYFSLNLIELLSC